MKNAKQQSGETGEVASQSAVRQAYSTATVMWDPPPRDYLSYLTHTHTHTHTHIYWSDTFPLLRSHFLPHYSTCLHSRCSFTLHFEVSCICIPAARCCILVHWVGVQTAPRVHLRNKQRNKKKKKTLGSSQELVDPEKNNSTFELSWKQPVIWAICVQLDLPELSSCCPVRCPCGGKEPCNIISRYA